MNLSDWFGRKDDEVVFSEEDDAVSRAAIRLLYEFKVLDREEVETTGIRSFSSQDDRDLIANYLGVKYTTRRDLVTAVLKDDYLLKLIYNMLDCKEDVLCHFTRKAQVQYKRGDKITINSGELAGKIAIVVNVNSDSYSVKEQGKPYVYKVPFERVGVSNMKQAQREIKMRVGDRAKITEGPYAGSNGVVEQVFQNGYYIKIDGSENLWRVTEYEVHPLIGQNASRKRPKNTQELLIFALRRQGLYKAADLVGSTMQAPPPSGKKRVVIQNPDGSTSVKELDENSLEAQELDKSAT